MKTLPQPVAQLRAFVAVPLSVTINSFRSGATIMPLVHWVLAVPSPQGLAPGIVPIYVFVSVLIALTPPLFLSATYMTLLLGSNDRRSKLGRGAVLFQFGIVTWATGSNFCAPAGMTVKTKTNSAKNKK